MTAPTTPNRWTASVEWSGSEWTVRITVLGSMPRSIWCNNKEQAESLAEQINRPVPAAPTDDLLTLDYDKAHEEADRLGAPGNREDTCLSERLMLLDASTDDLPEGVERISDGTLWLRAGDDMPTYAAPDGYEWLTFSGEWSTKSMPYGMRPCMVQVRPIPAPATEKVPWWEAVGRKLRPPHDCPIVKVGCSGSRGPWVATSEKAIGATNFVDADGMVEVLVECES